MPLFEGAKRVDGSRSNTALVKSGHMSPAEDWILDPMFNDPSMSAIFNNGIMFEYSYGGPGQTEVVIPKGRMVGVTNPVKDFGTQKFKPVITLPGLAPGGNTIGMAPYNFIKDQTQADRLGGNKPSIITLDYVTLPYIPEVSASTGVTAADLKNALLTEEGALTRDLKNPWGAIIGAGLKIGDYVKSTPSGRLTKWDRATDNAADIVGQILGQDFNQEPFGWMKWMLWDPSTRQEDDAFINRSGASNLPSDAGYPFDPTYKDGNTTFQNYQTQFVTDPTGIPGLHDGSGNNPLYGINDTVYKDVPFATVPASGITDNTLMAFQLLDYAGGKLTNIRTLQSIKVNGVAIADATRITVNYKTGLVTIRLMAADMGRALTATFTASHFGIPSYLDFKGVVGSFNIILKK